MQSPASEFAPRGLSCWRIGRWVAVFSVLPPMLAAFGAVRYVAVNSASPSPPYTNWATAATAIQEAVDAATAGDTVLVTNGVYTTGGRAVYGMMTNRVAVDKRLTLLSVNGPQFTIIQGAKAAGGGTGDGAIRCAYLTNGAILSGFTLTNGATRKTGEWLDLSGGGVWSESTSAVVSNCVLAGNSAASMAGGAYYGTLNNCMLKGNSADLGGGAYFGVLNNCTLAGNLATGYHGAGGGAYGGTLNNCTLAGNMAQNGGGGASSDLYGDPCTLNNCALTSNSAGYNGGGASCGRLNNCTLTGNSAQSSGGGTCYSTLNNCIVYFNLAADGPNHDDDSTLNYCCTTPLPAGGVGNLSLDPQLASASHLSASSPCRGAGSASYASGTDIDGEPWASPPSIGCDEYHAGAVTGPLSVSIMATLTNVAVGYLIGFTALTEGPTSATVWDFGDGMVTTNQPFTTHAWGTPGDPAAVLRAYNDSHPGGVSATVTVHVVVQPVHYVTVGSAHPLPPYTNWATAANNIQDAVDVAAVTGALVLVSNGVYATGGRAVGTNVLVNRVAVDKPLTVRSVNAAQFTAIQGYQVPGTINGDGAIRCAYLTNGAILSGFTLTNGATRSTGDITHERCGGGLWCESVSAVVSDCVLMGNAADQDGGGAYYGTLNNCTLTGNSAGWGGGASTAVLNNCNLTGNAAGQSGGGTYQGRLTNCRLVGNRGTVLGGGSCSGALTGCTLMSNSAYRGGGSYGGTLNECTLTGNTAADQAGGACLSTVNNCTLAGNSAMEIGGGVAGGMLNNCTLTGNSAGRGGGAAGSMQWHCSLEGCWEEWTPVTLNNCIVYFNTSSNGANFYSPYSTLNYCCTTPLPTNGFGNLANAPLFVDYPGGNLRLQSDSPCINAGLNDYAPGATDLDGHPRIIGGTVDIGAYEFQGTGPTAFQVWLQEYGLPTDGSADFTDPDADGMNNWQEWRCGTNPTNALSVLRLLAPVATGSNVTVNWQSVAGVNYFLERSTNLAASPRFTPLATNLPGQAGATTYTDTNAAAAPRLFYRVGVGN